MDSLHFIESKDLKQNYEETIKNINNKELDFFWVVKFNDGTEKVQFNKDGTENYGDYVNDIFKRDDVKEAFFIPFRDDIEYFDDKCYGVKLESDDRLILFRRNFLKFKPTDIKNQSKSTKYCLGYQRTKDGKNFKEIMFLDSDGYVIE
jgi:hypothetical protein